jgi:hypothetical protein
VIPTLSLDHFTRLRVLVQLHSTRLTSAFHWRGGGSFAWLKTTLRIQDRDDVFLAFVVFAQQGAQFALKLNFVLKAFVTLQSLKGGKLFSKMTL